MSKNELRRSGEHQRCGFANGAREPVTCERIDVVFYKNVLYLLSETDAQPKERKIL